MILCDVAREDASVIISDLRELDIDREGSIAMEMIDSQISDAALVIRGAVDMAIVFPLENIEWEYERFRRLMLGVAGTDSGGEPGGACTDDNDIRCLVPHRGT